MSDNVVITALNPKRKLLDQVADWLGQEAVEDLSGAKSLAHLMVVVPTAQSGRRLRQKLAAHFGAIIPPTIVQPQHLVLPPAMENIAGRTDELLAFQAALGEKGSLEVAAQFSDIRGILGANALTFADVAARVGEILNDENADLEIERWRGFAEIEKHYFAALEKSGKVDRVIAIKSILENPPELEGVKTIVLAGLLDPLPALQSLLEIYRTRDNLKIIKLSVACSSTEKTVVLPCATATSEAEKAAEYFAAVKSDEALPALCVADAEEYPEVQCAMQAKGLKVHDPSCIPLATSSLGHLVDQVVALSRTRSYGVFSAFIRGGDVRRWLCKELSITESEYVLALTQLDNKQAELLPETMDDIRTKTKGKLRAIFDAVDIALRKKGIRQILQAIFKDRLLDERDADAREFAAAATVVSELLDECGAQLDLLAMRLKETTYSLEPDEGEVVLTDGWLEVPFLDADELYIMGFNEGRVPESVIGHAFLPDRLRRGLGLVDNVARAARDLQILRLALACRAPGAVKISFRSIDAAGDSLKPSRLLFDGLNDQELIECVKRFYGVKSGTAEMRSADLPSSWKLKLDIPPMSDKLIYTSPSSIDLYLKCPFTYYLKKTFGEKTDDRAEELDASEFGNLIHGALERWGMGSLKDSEDEKAIADDLALHVDEILAERFGLAVPAIVDLQAQSAKRRLEAFAAIQCEWHKQGWRTMATERKMKVVYGHTNVSGRCDRIDCNLNTGKWCVIDYKTFDTPDRAIARDQKSGEWKSLQLPLYCAMLGMDKEFSGIKREDISSVYCVLGKTPEYTQYSAPITGDQLPEAEEKIKAIITNIEQGIFWPPTPKDEWRYDFKDWIFNTPLESVDEEWIADQERRRNG